ncbi:MAG: extracellular solute-binding protein, partial [Moorea sp. SIO2B7]|nr:extracellular solute-binding protein [Moorena sp. SIO2B7]
MMKKLFILFFLCFLGLIFLNNLVDLPIKIGNYQVNLTLLIPREEENPWQKIVELFETNYPNIHLNLALGPNSSKELAEVYLNDFQKDEPEYDLVYLDVTWTAQFARNEWVKDLSSFKPKLTQKEKLQKEFLKNDVEAGFYNDKLYRFPFRSDVSLVYYRQDLLNEIQEQPPTSFDDLIRISQILKSQSLVEQGYLWQGREDEGLVAIFVEILKGFGSSWTNDNIEKLLDKLSAKKTIHFLGALIQKHKISPPSVLWDKEIDSQDKFKKGRAAFLRNWAAAWEILNAEDSKVRGKVGVIPIPTVEDSQYSWSCQGGWGLGIANQTKYPEEAWITIQFLTSIPSQRLFALYGYIPTR